MFGKLMHRMRKVPLFPVIPLIPIGIVVSDTVLAILSYKRLKRLETQMGRARR